jgi:hypothetical protein
LKQQLDQGFPVIIGAFVNESIPNDSSFDHQCIISGYELSSDKQSVETLWLLDTYQIRAIPFDCRLGPYACLSGDACPNPEAQPKPVPPKYPLEPFPVRYCRRADFADPNQQAPYDVAIPNIMDTKDSKTGDDLGNAFATVFGNVDPLQECFPCMLKMSSCYEPNWSSEDQIGAPPQPISCQVFISGLTAREKYSLIRFDNPADVPTAGKFLASSGYTLRQDFVPCSSAHTISVQHDPKIWPFMSNGTYFFRCVKTTEPPKQNFPYGTDRTDTKPAPLPHLGPPPRHFVSEFESRLKQRMLNFARPRFPLLPPRAVSMVTAADPPPPTVSANIVCGDSDTGNIASLWEWKFPDPDWRHQKGYGVFTVNFTVQDHGSEAANCINFQVANADDVGPQLDSVTGVIIYDVDGTNPRLYIEDVNNMFTYSFSPESQNQDGSWTMLSQDGVTYSTLRPIGA